MPTRTKVWLMLAGAGLATAAILVAARPGMGSPPHGEGEAPAAPKTPIVEDGKIIVPHEYAQTIKLEFGEVLSRELEPVVGVTGSVGFDEKRVAAVGSRIAGRVYEVKISEGDTVDVGAVLGLIESADLGTAQADVYAAQARYDAARNQERRRKNLRDEGVGSERMAEEAIADAAIAHAELMAARQRVEALGGSTRGKRLGVATLATPIAGQVVNVHIYRGQAVSPADNLFTIADLRSVWVNLNVFEGDLNTISEGDPVEIRPQNGEELVLHGQVARVSSVIDPDSRSARVRVIVPNEALDLRIGQSVSARIRTRGEVRRTLAVPTTSIVRIDGQPTLFVDAGEGVVELRAVTLGESSGDLTEIVDGVSAGEHIATTGVFALKSEIFR